MRAFKLFGDPVRQEVIRLSKRLFGPMISCEETQSINDLLVKLPNNPDKDKQVEARAEKTGGEFVFQRLDKPEVPAMS